MYPIWPCIRHEIQTYMGSSSTKTGTKLAPIIYESSGESKTKKNTKMKNMITTPMSKFLLYQDLSLQQLYNDNHSLKCREINDVTFCKPTSCTISDRSLIKTSFHHFHFFFLFIYLILFSFTLIISDPEDMYFFIHVHEPAGS